MNKASRRKVSHRKSAPRPAPELCGRFHRASELIGRRWTGAILFVMLRTPCRFAVLREAIPEITDRMLSERLQELEREGIVERIVTPQTPVRVEYSLTRKGRALGKAVKAIQGWAHTWIDA
jgi:DNA-binding HxlR family transcriptional regulator